MGAGVNQAGHHQPVAKINGLVKFPVAIQIFLKAYLSNQVVLNHQVGADVVYLIAAIKTGDSCTFY